MLAKDTTVKQVKEECDNAFERMRIPKHIYFVYLVQVAAWKGAH
jgi:hypothetical protein